MDETLKTGVVELQREYAGTEMYENVMCKSFL